MSMKGKMVHSDKRKGLLYVYQSEDSLMHFCWKDRSSGTVEDDLIIFPDDCEFKRVTQCTTGRVYVLKFKSSNKKFFFWVQEPKTDRDDENCRKLNEVLNNPPTPGSNRSGGVTPDGDIQNLLSNMSQQQLVQLFGGVGQISGLSSLLGTMNASRPSTSQGARSSSVTASAGSTESSNSSSRSVTIAPLPSNSGSSTTPVSTKPASAKPATGGSDSSQNPIQLRDLRNYLSGLNVPSAEGIENQADVDLSTALNADNLQPMLSNPNFVQELQQHLPALGESGDPQEQLRATLTSPQFQQALTSFSVALQSGQMGPVINQFNVSGDAVTAANRGNMEEFVKALQKTSLSGDSSSPGSASTEATQPEKKKKLDDSKRSSEEKKDDDDEGMSMD